MKRTKLVYMLGRNEKELLAYDEYDSEGSGKWFTDNPIMANEYFIQSACEGAKKEGLDVYMWEATYDTTEKKIIKESVWEQFTLGEAVQWNVEHSDEEMTKTNFPETIEIDFERKLDDDFRVLFTSHLRKNNEFGKELWSAMANVIWYHLADPNKTECGYSFRAAGDLIASMLCKGDYMDWYCSGPDGTVSDYIAESMLSRGWRYKFYERKTGE
jgi:hypothetical protein